jgi:hypothetical protein
MMTLPTMTFSMSDARAAGAALAAPVILLLVLAPLVGVPLPAVVHTLVGMVGVTVGGVALGVTAWRYLGHSRAIGEALFGFGACSAIGLVAIGYVYLVYLDVTMASIGDPSRAVKQTLIFVMFLCAAYAGAVWAPGILSRWRRARGASHRAEEGEVSGE